MPIHSRQIRMAFPRRLSIRPYEIPTMKISRNMQNIMYGQRFFILIMRVRTPALPENVIFQFHTSPVLRNRADYSTVVKWWAMDGEYWKAGRDPYLFTGDINSHRTSAMSGSNWAPRHRLTSLTASSRDRACL